MSQRIREIADAAARLFIQQGYARTQIGHIAKAVGVSVGTIYLDFTGKREILHFVLKSAVDPDFPEREFQRPITDELFQGLEEELAEVFRRAAADFERRLGDDSYGLEGLASDAFDLMARHAAVRLFLEKNQADFPALAGTYRAYRRRFFDAMAQYMDGFIRRRIVRPLAQPGLSTALIIEILSWWAMDMRCMAFESPGVSLEEAKAVCLDNILHGYGA